MKLQLITAVLWMLLSSPGVAGQACACVGCTSTFSLGAGVTETIPNACSSSQIAKISTLNVQSTDGSSFTVATTDSPGASQEYTQASSNSAVTCFNSPFGVLVGGSSTAGSTIYVAVRCNNLIESCPLMYNIQYECTAGSSSSSSSNLCQNVNCGANGQCNSSSGQCTCNGGYTGSSCQTPPVSSSSAATGSAGSSSSSSSSPPKTDYCYCSGSLSQAPATFAGYVTNVGCAGTCSSMCATAFPSQCPASGQNGINLSSCTTVQATTTTTTSTPSAAASIIKSSTAALVYAGATVLFGIALTNGALFSC